MKWIEQLTCSHDLQWIPFKTLTSWHNNHDGTLSWNYDLFGHKCNKCGAIRYKRYIRDNGVITK